MNTSHTVEIVHDLLVVLDQDGNAANCHKLTGLRSAKRQLRRWQMRVHLRLRRRPVAVSEFFASVE